MKEKEEEKKKKYETDFSPSMAADGGRRIRMFCVCDNRKILDSSRVIFSHDDVFVCGEFHLFLVLLNNVLSKKKKKERNNRNTPCINHHQHL